MGIEPISAAVSGGAIGLSWIAREAIRFILNKKNSKNNDHLKEVKDEVKEIRKDTVELKVEVGKIQENQKNTSHQLDRIFGVLNGK